MSKVKFIALRPECRELDTNLQTLNIKCQGLRVEVQRPKFEGRTTLRFDWLQRSDHLRANVWGLILYRTILCRSILWGSILYRPILHRSILRGPILSRSILRRPILWGAIHHGLIHRRLILQGLIHHGPIHHRQIHRSPILWGSIHRWFKLHQTSNATNLLLPLPKLEVHN